jgi:hypothetical protein
MYLGYEEKRFFVNEAVVISEDELTLRGKRIDKGDTSRVSVL